MDVKSIVKKIFNKKTTPVIITVICTITAIAIFICSLNKVGVLRANKVKINFNDGAPLMESSVALSPMETWTGRAFIENTGKCSVYYRLYLKNIDGALSDKIELTVMIDGNIFYQGVASEFTINNAIVSEKEFNKGEKADVLLILFFNAETEDEGQSKDFRFEVQVDAVQTKNNPNKLFN